ncbi:MAG TPA: YciI family protein [Ktedonobacteraceae bacterium]|jgi:hypothetical protein|nr:YciI family protein [Ktedonobacteraceae bacterium]
MRYLALIYDNEAAYAAWSEEARVAEYQAYNNFGAEQAQFLGGGKALQPSNTATTVRVRDGKTLTTDGPFAETKDQIGGYYLLNCKDLDEAIEVAAKIPSATHGAVEIRPVLEFD